LADRRRVVESSPAALDRLPREKSGQEVSNPQRFGHPYLRDFSPVTVSSLPVLGAWTPFRLGIDWRGSLMFFEGETS
jgi:hypothetical protein